MLKKIAGAALVGGAVLMFVGGSAKADQPTPVVPPHQHFVLVPGTGERVPVGPDACANGPSIAFDNFHFNVHRGVPGVKNGLIVSAPCAS